jgi:hypothetical protein
VTSSGGGLGWGVAAGAGEVAGGDLEAVEEEGGALVVEGAGGDAGEDVGEGELDGGRVVDGEHGEDGVEGFLAEVFGRAAGGVVVVAEVFAAQAGRAAAAAFEVDVAALVAGFGLGGWLRVGLLWHGRSPLGVLGSPKIVQGLGLGSAGSLVLV